MRSPRAFATTTLAVALTLAACSAAKSEPETTLTGGTPTIGPIEQKTAAERQPFTIAFGGDIHFEGALRGRLNNPKTALGPISRVLSRADLAVVNLETAITTGGTPAPGKQYTFRAPASALTALKAAGVDVASLANNHGMDYMESGLRDTLASIKRSKFPVIGVGKDDDEAYKPFRATVNGHRVAVIGATQVLDAEFIQSWTAGPGKAGLASAKNEARLIQAVREARKNSDTVVVFLHWGTELQACPNPAQSSLAPKLARAGADVIVGGHAHQLLGSGYLGKAYVNYGLGNFVFYNWGPVTGKTGVLTLTIDGRKVVKDVWTPATIQAPGLPVPLRGAAARQAIADWKSLRSCAGLSAKP